MIACIYGLNGFSDAIDSVFPDPALTKLAYLAYHTVRGVSTKIGSECFMNCRNIKSVTLSGIDELGSNTFDYCRTIDSIDLGSNIRAIGRECFSNCDALRELILPEGLTELKADTIYSCDQLETIVIPSSVGEIGKTAIYDCRNLKHVYCKAVTPPYCLYSDIIDRCSNDFIIHVPANSVKAYQAANAWKSYASSIEGYAF